MYEKSQKLFAEAKEVMPGGVNSPVRAFKSIGMDPIFFTKAKGAYVYDADGNEYVDYVASWGPMILGHAHPRIVSAVQKAAEKGTSFGAPTEIETEMAKLVIEAVPSIEMVRMVNSGTEAVISALRVARGFTGRNKIIKFAGGYHGHGDSLLIKAGSGVTTLGLPDSPGVTEGVAQDTITVNFNDLEAVKEVFNQIGEEIAAVIIEPIAGNMGLAIPQEGFLEGLREVTQKHGALLIFDEVMTGFRVAYGGAQELYNVTPDLTTLGKVIGGGLPVGAFGGRKDIMEQVAPAGPIYQAGTLSGNPLAMAAGREMLLALKENRTYEKLEKTSALLASGLKEVAKKHDIEVTFKRVGSMSCVYFTDQDVFDFPTAATSSIPRFRTYFKTLLENGVYIAPSQFEAGFVSLAHTLAEVEKTIHAADKAFAAAKEVTC
ncbi:glutamate-1-semialdehyde 2,1-aminomutase [Dethiobacter alkaliphilus]|uniref:glutamate-1-semialdehyde 2,1-aminomutase n=1 Tax=Dethiobacter alkaliphilus TaxID=427926 RepID=UPI002226D7F3|nr:glutamate-1-semialdehyde 2,1-aminomutase [Dethiobacter alkaliphilus]MCW3491149.1 glutamate-1-semialdehyde 2,1-aminomutase [Dethiobacter alkaliphilus]